MTTKLFILGLTGSGKSTVSKYVLRYMQEHGVSVTHFNDYDILKKMFLNAIEPQKFYPSEQVSFEVLDTIVFDAALHQLEHKICDFCLREEEDLITIEFCRSDYQKAFELFTGDFLKNSYYIFLNADVNTCLKRVTERAVHPFSKDDYFVSAEVILRHFSNIYMPPVIHDVKVEFIDNSSTPISQIAIQVNGFLDKIYTNFLTLRNYYV